MLRWLGKKIHAHVERKKGLHNEFCIETIQWFGADREQLATRVYAYINSGGHGRYHLMTYEEVTIADLIAELRKRINPCQFRSPEEKTKPIFIYRLKAFNSLFIFW
ncbi:hypothetical protein BXP70_25540 [Hymenobacter crusticola]|uniref:Uncharacterized protein n=1 Tax=Hymenobacter crusticola TaxID=1770526 RepID=A0A243W6L1_9BACT|nr:hypothetical protein BXP70_25540 [Hymenobacter crusticola]